MIANFLNVTSIGNNNDIWTIFLRSAITGEVRDEKHQIKMKLVFEMLTFIGIKLDVRTLNDSNDS